MKNKIIVICAVLFFTNCTAQKTNTVITIQLKNYQKYASNYIDEKYDEVAKISDSVLKKYGKSLVAYNYKKAQLAMYSCPIFSLKKENIDYATLTNIIDAIDFTNQYENQVINIYTGDILLSNHTVNSVYKTPINLNEQFDEFSFFENTLLRHTNQVIIGLPAEVTDIYAYKEQLEKKHFVFFIEGIDTYFIIKNNMIYAIKMICKEKGIDQKSYEQFFNCLQPEFVEINTYFKEIELAFIHDKQFAKKIAAFKKTKHTENQKVTFKVEE